MTERDDSALQQRIAVAIRGAVADERLSEVIIRKVALHTADGLLSKSDLRAALDELAEGRRAGTIRSSGAYFVAIAKRLYRQAGLPWLNKHTATALHREPRQRTA
jgi:hypothetical protein